MNAHTRPRRAIRAGIATLLAATVAAAGVAFGMWRPWGPTSAGPAGSPASTAVTVPVELGTLTSELRLNATLGFGDPAELPPAPGVITALPTSGRVIEVGQEVYEVEGRPVVLFEGTRPFWRGLSRGSPDGKDVLQLEQNLARLGFFDRQPDARFDWWTAEAVRRWQQELGVPATGRLEPAEVVVVDAPSIRISRVTGNLAESGVSPATYTANTLSAVAKLTPAQANELTAGTPVRVLLPDGTELETTIAAVNPGEQPVEEDGRATPPVAVVEFPDQEQVAATGPAAIRMVVPTTEEGTETLIVPVTALIATAKNRYAVEVLADERILRIPVQIGLVADARVQILASGPDVEGAPSSARALVLGDPVVISR